MLLKIGTIQAHVTTASLKVKMQKVELSYIYSYVDKNACK